MQLIPLLLCALLAASAKAVIVKDGSVTGTSTSNQKVFVGEQDGATPSSDASSSTYPQAQHSKNPFNRIHLRSPDDSLRATFIPLGASMIEFWKQDRDNVWRDIIVGYDDTEKEDTDPVHPYFGPQVGRYANRIRNGTFSIDGRPYYTPLNEKNTTTIHGGQGFDRRAYEVTALNASSVQFTLHDEAGNQGFPGAVLTVAEYTLKNNGQFDIRMDAKVVGKEKSPIMLSHHVYWALHGYNGTQSILGHTLHLPVAEKYIETDPILVPTGLLPSVQDTPYDFRKPSTFASLFNDTEGVCGSGCQGWDSCFVLSEHNEDQSILTLTSPESGIQMDVKTNQDAVQIYTCNGISGAAGSIPRKRAHGGDGTLDKIYENYSCVVIEMEDYIDGINNPAWGRNQIYDEDRPYQWRAEYSFSTFK